MPSDQDQDRGQDRRAPNHGADVAPGSRQRLRRGIPEGRVDLARRRDAGQLVVAVVVAVHFVARRLGLGSPSRAFCKRQPPSVRRGSVGAVCPPRRRGGSGAAFLAGFFAPRKAGSREKEVNEARWRLGVRPCVCSTRLRTTYDALATPYHGCEVSGSGRERALADADTRAAGRAMLPASDAIDAP